MKELDAELENARYRIYITNNFDSLDACLDKHKINEKIMLVTDSHVSKLYVEPLLKHINGRELYVFSIGEGEEAKNLITINKIYEKCVEYNLSRSSVIIAFGGGVVGDTAGFAASTYMRGLKLVHIPTTIMSSVDSSIGGKVGVNYKHMKNMIGNFYHPKFVYINTSTFRTLDSKQICSGMAEIIKYAVLFDKDFFNYLNENVSGLVNLESDKLNYVIKKCIDFKLNIIKNDVRDENERRLLNFGHTLGHAVEAMSGYSVCHGEAVAVGMIFETLLSNTTARLNYDEMIKIIKLIKKYGLGHKFDLSDTDKIVKLMKHDKKADRDNIRFVLLNGIGLPSIVDNIDSSLIVLVLKMLGEYLS